MGRTESAHARCNCNSPMGRVFRRAEVCLWTPIPVELYNPQVVSLSLSLSLTSSARILSMVAYSSRLACA